MRATGPGARLVPRSAGKRRRDDATEGALSDEFQTESGFRTAETAERPRALLIGVESPGAPWDAVTSMTELAALCESADLEPVGEMWQRLAHPHPKHYLGKGKLEEVKERAALDAIDVIVADDELSPRMQATLEEELGRRVADRTAVILDVFARRARTHEGRIQVELAQYEFMLPRLRTMWVEFSRLGGGIGTRGPGETQLEVDRRQVRQRISVLRREIEEVRHHRGRLRRQRRAQALPMVALVGYTNAGKTTLLRALTGEGDARVADAPFVTLDPLTRRASLPSGQPVLISDTVGFIAKLPAALVAAFRATLEELSDAELLVHVVDLSDPRAEACMVVVAKLLGELGLSEKPLVWAFNKADAVADGARRAKDLAVAAQQSGAEPTDSVVVSAANGVGLDALLACLERHASRTMPLVHVCIPYDRSELVDLFYRRGQPLRVNHGPDGTEIEGRLPLNLLPRFEGYVGKRTKAGAGARRGAKEPG